MKTGKRTLVQWLLVGVVSLLLPLSVRAWEPNAGELDAAVKSGDFTAYFGNLSAWLGAKAPAAASGISEASMNTLLADAVFAKALSQRQLLSKVGSDNMGTFAKVGEANRTFLSWVLGNNDVMVLFLDGATPVGTSQREANNWTIPVSALEIWSRIFHADADSKEGVCLRMAMAVGLNPPGTTTKGAGGAATHADPLARYNHFKTAWKDNELALGFEDLTVWEYRYVLSSHATDEDLAWGREMVNTFRPDLRVDEQAVNTTSMVWRRNAPSKFYPAGYVNFKNVLAGGGKCGPRSSWAVFICHAFGIPAIGVGQPAHACAAYKAINPYVQPQPGYAWKVVQGRGWVASKLLGMSGNEFIEGVELRAQAKEFLQVERLRWLASALAPAERAAAVMEVAATIAKATPVPDAAAREAMREATTRRLAERAAARGKASSAASPPASSAPGVIFVEAASFEKTGGEVIWGGQAPDVLVHDCFTGGKQVYFQQQMKSQWADYNVEIPASGVYTIVMKTTCINDEQALEVCAGDNVLATVEIPLTFGVWQETEPVELKLEKGLQTLRIQRPTTEHKRGIALRSFALKAK